ncbi:MAG TPA: CotH kinase family protein [Kofleriaceae bacterium]|nr:CotH kinase family protein [Kofleriaceae bacterium]
MKRLGLVAAVVGLIGCGSSGGGADPADAGVDAEVGDLTEQVFDPAHVLQVDITLAAADWDLIRHQGRDLSALAGDCQAGPPAKIYETVEASVTIDGTTLDRIGLRKKGFLGSISTIRPSLKLDLDELVAGQKYSGLSRLTLNNNRQDGSRLRTCMVYQVFAAAGMPTPRCNYARVTVNGVDLGVYSNVEAIKKPFLRRHFSDDSGNLYEGQLSDFRAGWSATFEKKTNAVADRSDIDALVAALEMPDAELLAALEPLLDIDAFLTHWALESLTGHWDGYANNHNNFYLYADPTTGKFRFIPWGPDIGYTTTDPFSSPTRPVSVSAASRLARRLYALPAIKADYVARMRTLLDEVWDEDALLAEVDRLDTLLAGAPDPAGLTEIRNFITGRRAAFEVELDAGGASWPFPEATAACWREGATTTGTFSAPYGSLNSLNPFAQGSAQLVLTIGGTAVPFTSLGVVSGHENGEMIIRYVGQTSTELVVVQLVVDDELFQPSTMVPYHGFATYGVIVRGPNVASLTIAGFIANGRIDINNAGRTDGANVSGTFTGTVIEAPNL